GPNQYPEKLLPLFVTNALDGEPLPLYGDGRQVRDWLHVDDHCAAVELVLRQGEAGQVYNIGADEEHENVELTKMIVEHLGADRSLVRSVEDRAGHDRRYSLETAKVRALGWQPRRDWGEGVRATIDWYRDNRDWWEPIKRSGVVACLHLREPDVVQGCAGGARADARAGCRRDGDGLLLGCDLTLGRHRPHVRDHGRERGRPAAVPGEEVREERTGEGAGEQ